MAETLPLVCRAVFEELCVLANGDVVCSTRDAAGERIYGNVHCEPIAAIYRSALYRGIRRYQLHHEASPYCPIVQDDCAYRVYPALPYYYECGAAIKRLQIEPTTACNLRCPQCPATHFALHRDFYRTRLTTLPLEVMLRVVDQLPDLEQLLFFNFGEPFLHPRAIEFLQAVRSRRPALQIHTSTNGLPLSEEQIETIARERLLDKIVFSIDGSQPSTYSHYRQGGDFQQVIRNLEHLVQSCRRYGSRALCEVVWQYILFEWNDADEELARAQQMAADIGVPILWVLTDTPGASKRYRLGSAACRDLFGERSYENLSLGSQLQDRQEHQGIKGQIYWAGIGADRTRIEVERDRTAVLSVTVTNRSLQDWASEGAAPFSLAARLLDLEGNCRRELHQVALPAHVRRGQQVHVDYELDAPGEAGEYLLFLDIVEPGVCWFSDRGSPPTIVPLRVV